MKVLPENSICVAMASEDLKKKVDKELIIPDQIPEVAKAILLGEPFDAK